MGSVIVFLGLLQGTVSALQLYLAAIGNENLNMGLSMWAIAMSVIGVLAIFYRDSILLQVHALGATLYFAAFIPIVVYVAWAAYAPHGIIFLRQNVRHCITGYFLRYATSTPFRLDTYLAVYLAIYCVYNIFLAYYCICAWALFRRLRTAEYLEAGLASNSLRNQSYMQRPESEVASPRKHLTAGTRSPDTSINFNDDGRYDYYSRSSMDNSLTSSIAR
ncbi:hypothetical protein IWQ60_004907 [Tieghemiomyces parasiticus]|uniref:MARVEL domain-containing protein n=1 Tax=Tieghemiomyces parasiticus TaxID=78921 RepID=A0A9W8AF17_9FUNG|nr:hypothetical protein IWQ60_004907 [Tieghemiomyces parasiticus]